LSRNQVMNSLAAFGCGASLNTGAPCAQIGMGSRVGNASSAALPRPSIGRGRDRGAKCYIPGIGRNSSTSIDGPPGE
jgi:hypothetical protein